MGVAGKPVQKQREGASLVLSMVFILVFSALAVSMAASAGTNTQIASSRRRVASALAGAASGLEVKRYWLNRVVIPSSTPPSAYLSSIVNAVRNDMAGHEVSNIALNENGSFALVTLDVAAGQCFTGQILVNPANPNILQLYSTGRDGQITRTIGVYFNIEPCRHPILNFALATRGPLTCTGNLTIRSAHAPSQANLYVESANNTTAVCVGGNANFAGDVMISNPVADVDFAGEVLIAGAHGQTAIDNHIFTGVDRAQFPIPDTAQFLRYATGETIDFTSDLSASLTLKNATVAAGTNPHFSGSVVIQGILLVKSPNVVTFGGDVNLLGLIVAEGHTGYPEANRIDFCGNFNSGPYPEDAEFDSIRGQVGSCILAPGFAVSFQGACSSVEGVMAVSGVHFSGHVNAVIKGTIINYSESPVLIEGDATLCFDRDGSTKIPAGFDSHRVLTYNPYSYEVFAM